MFRPSTAPGMEAKDEMTGGQFAWVKPDPDHFDSAADYARAVRKWIERTTDSLYWHSVLTAFPSFVMYQTLVQQQQQYYFRMREMQRSSMSGRGPHTWTDVLSRVSNFIYDRRIGNVPRVHTPDFGRLAEIGGREYKIPSLWKRFTAEFVDFAILFLLKLFFTYIAMDFFDMIDLEKYNEFQEKGGTIDYQFALQITSEIFVLELIHRVVVCLFEALCLHQGTNGVGGATPGKSLMGLRVVSCEGIQPLHGSYVLVWPARDIGFGWALLRSIIKNFSMALFIPACVTMLFFPFHRTIYDVLCGCLVVEDIQPIPRM